MSISSFTARKKMHLCLSAIFFLICYTVNPHASLDCHLYNNNNMVIYIALNTKK